MSASHSKSETDRFDVKISVITATKNSAETLIECLQSLQCQDHADLEHIIIDGNSTDASLEIIAQNLTPSMVVRSGPDRGIYDALNKGIEIATGDVIGFLHSDDVYASPTVLANVAGVLEDPKVSGVYGDLEFFSKSNPARVLRRWKSRPYRFGDIQLGWMPPHPTLYVRRDFYENLGGFDTSLKIASDYHSVIKLFSDPDFKPAYLPQTMVRMRWGGASTKSISAIVKKSIEDWSALRRSDFNLLAAAFALGSKNARKLTQFLG